MSRSVQVRYVGITMSLKAGTRLLHNADPDRELPVT